MRTPEDGVERVEVGRVVKAHGLRGEVAVHIDSDVPDRLPVGARVWVAGRESRVATTRPHQGRALIRFVHVTDRTGAELLRGAVVEAEPIDPDELDVYLVTELIGRPVVTVEGTSLGTVTALIEMPPVAGYDLLEVTRADGSTWLLPAADELVEVVELEAGEGGEDGAVDRRLVVHQLPEGLADAEGHA
jgi:16S rRNA processing protein RimM